MELDKTDMVACRTGLEPILAYCICMWYASSYSEIRKDVRVGLWLLAERSGSRRVCIATHPRINGVRTGAPHLTRRDETSSPPANSHTCTTLHIVRKTSPRFLPGRPDKTVIVCARWFFSSRSCQTTDLGKLELGMFLQPQHDRWKVTL